jgi:RTX calcium-binding nonapeptide repeat (4 copies)
MNILLIISISYLSLLMIPEYLVIIDLYAQDKNFKDSDYLLQIGTVCSDRSDQLPLLPNGTLMEPPPRCWFLPDFGEPLFDLEGDVGPDIIYGKDGLDVIIGLDGDDVLDGGNNDDQIYGDGGNDELFGSFGDDFLNGGDGNDIIVGSFGNDHMLGKAGDDEFYGGQGNDVLVGGSGSDFFDCGDDIDIVLDFKTAEGDTISQNCENANNNKGSSGFSSNK